MTITEHCWGSWSKSPWNILASRRQWIPRNRRASPTDETRSCAKTSLVGVGTGSTEPKFIMNKYNELGRRGAGVSKLPLRASPK